MCGLVAGTQESRVSGNAGVAYAAKLAFYDLLDDEAGHFIILRPVTKKVFPLAYHAGEQ